MRKTGLIFTFLLIACGNSKPPPKTSDTPPTAADAGLTAKTTGTAHKLVALSTACWLGGVWAEAEGETSLSEKRAGDEARCKEVIVLADGKENPDEMLPLRGLEPKVTTELKEKVDAFARKDGLDDAHVAGLSKLFAAIVDSQVEAMAARRSADKIKGDIEKLKSDKEKADARDKDSDRLTADEQKVAKELRATDKMKALSSLDAGPYSADAKALGVIAALERVKAARGLPPHLKIHMVAGAYQLMFGVEPPLKLTDDPPKPVKPGTWLIFEVATAKAAGHAVDDKGKKPAEVASLAWMGIVDGFGDKLKAARGGMSADSPFKDFVDAVIPKLAMKK